LGYEEKYHFPKCLDRYAHEEESEYTDDEMCSRFTETFDEIAPEHDDDRRDDTRECYRDNSIDHSISMH
jgi:hypothetical protein